MTVSRSGRPAARKGDVVGGVADHGDLRVGNGSAQPAQEGRHRCRRGNYDMHAAQSGTATNRWAERLNITVRLDFTVTTRVALCNSPPDGVAHREATERVDEVERVAWAKSTAIDGTDEEPPDRTGAVRRDRSRVLSEKGGSTRRQRRSACLRCAVSARHALGMTSFGSGEGCPAERRREEERRLVHRCARRGSQRRSGRACGVRVGWGPELGGTVPVFR
jgi:hypothetical protein